MWEEGAVHGEEGASLLNILFDTLSSSELFIAECLSSCAAFSSISASFF